jgi:triosephosphate isomerase
MKVPIIGGNWKMNRGSPSSALEMLKDFKRLVKNIHNVEIVITPPFTALNSVIKYLKSTNIKVGAQNMYFEDSGAFTGEVSPKFLKEIGCEYVILGHSERRDIFMESDDIINNKIKKALSYNLKPIVCLGEHLEEREAGKTEIVIEKQLNYTLKDLSKKEMMGIVIAYEPIWAIGTGKTATPEQAEEVHRFIRNKLGEKYDNDLKNVIRIQYGGSIKPSNAEDLFQKENIDGGLVGGASLEAVSLSEIIKSAEKTVNSKL